MSEDNYITYQDLPLNVSYVDAVKDLGVKVRRELKWFNAISCYLTDEEVEKVKKLEFVKSVERVKSRKRNSI